MLLLTIISEHLNVISKKMQKIQIHSNKSLNCEIVIVSQDSLCQIK